MIADFEYKTYGDTDRPAVPRLEWIRNQKPWSPQPYEFAARGLRLRGKEGSAKALQHSSGPVLSRICRNPVSVRIDLIEGSSEEFRAHVGDIALDVLNVPQRTPFR